MSSKKIVLESKDLVAGYLPGVDILTGCNFKLHQGELVERMTPMEQKVNFSKEYVRPSRSTKWCGPITQRRNHLELEAVE